MVGQLIDTFCMAAESAFRFQDELVRRLDPGLTAVPSPSGPVVVEPRDEPVKPASGAASAIGDKMMAFQSAGIDLLMECLSRHRRECDNFYGGRIAATDSGLRSFLKARTPEDLGRVVEEQLAQTTAMLQSLIETQAREFEGLVARYVGAADPGA